MTTSPRGTPVIGFLFLFAKKKADNPTLGRFGAAYYKHAQLVFREEVKKTAQLHHHGGAVPHLIGIVPSLYAY